jgi:hypothetical protein
MVGADRSAALGAGAKMTSDFTSNLSNKAVWERIRTCKR